MAHPVVHFEIIGRDPERLRRFYAGLFGWEFDTSGSIVEEVSEAGQYGFVEPDADGAAAPIPGGVGGGTAYAPQVVFYVGVPDVAAALAKAQELGGAHRMGPARAAGRDLVVAHFADLEGNLVGLAGPA